MRRKRGERVRGGKGRGVRGGVRFCLLIIYYTDTAAQPDSPHKESRRKKRGGKGPMEKSDKNAKKPGSKNLKCPGGEKM